jgi:iron complex outermembrane receptor protein
LSALITNKIITVFILSLFLQLSAFAEQKIFYFFDVPATRLDSAINQLAIHAGYSAIFPSIDVKQQSSNAVIGQFTLQQALHLALADTGFIARINADQVITIHPDRIANNNEDKAMPNKKRRGLFSAIASLLMGAGINTAAVNSSAADTAAHQSETLFEEVTVTAQRREENIQSVPVSITAFSADNLEQLSVSDPQSMADFVPNFSIGTTTGQSSSGAQFSIRGISEAMISPVLDPAVGIYIDDVYYGRPQINFLKLLDVERVEVLRGPQGTLFGKNSTGGALRYVTKRPDLEYTGGEVSVGFGNLDQRRVSGKFNLPLSDTAALRLAAAHIERDGWVVRQSDGIGLGSEETKFFSAQLRFQPSDRLSIDANINYSDTEDNGGATKLYDYCTFNSPAEQTLGCGGPPAALAPVSAWTNVLGWNAVYGNTPLAYNPDIPNDLYQVAGTGRIGFTETDSTGISLDINYDISDYLSIRSITGYRKMETLEDRESNDSPVPGYWDKLVAQESDFWSQEFQLNGLAIGDRLNWVAGVFYSVEEPSLLELYDPYSGFNRQIDNSFSTFTNRHTNRFVQSGGAASRVSDQQQETKSFGIFAQADYSLTEALTLTLGIRYSEDDKSYTAIETLNWHQDVADAVLAAIGGTEIPGMTLNPADYTVGSCDLSQTGSCITSPADTGSDTFSSTTPRVALEYQATDSFMVYGAASKGFKAGGVNDVPGFANIPFDPEEVWSYEIGTRYQGERVRANLTAFTMDYTGKLTTVALAQDGPCPTTRCTLNGGDATISGVEIETLTFLTDSLQLNLSLATLDAEWDEVDPNGGAAIDSEFAHAPELSYTIGLRHDTDLAGGQLTSTINLAYKDEQQSNGQDSTSITVPDYTLVNGRISYISGNNWKASLYCTNCFDEEYITGGTSWAGGASNTFWPEFQGSAGHVGHAPPTVGIVNVGAPRMFGLDFTYYFGD